jgi:hypothetical protein
MKKTIVFLFASILLSLSTIQAQVRLIGANPASGTITIKNFGSTPVNVASHRVCHLFTYHVISSLTLVSGSMSNLMPGGNLVVSGVALNTSSSDLALYLPTGAFTDINSMLDFVQWGSTGNGRESVAISKGIWDAGTFLTIAPPYQYTGDGSLQFGIIFWQTSTGIIENDVSRTVTIFPNPVINQLTINVSSLNNVTIKVFNLLGEELIIERVSSINQQYQLNIKNLTTGKYFLLIESEEGLAVKKIIVA